MPSCRIHGKDNYFTHKGASLKTLFSLIFFLFSITLPGQNILNPEYNFGFEKISFKDNLPLDWIKWGTDNYLLKSDSVVKHSGTFSLSIQSNNYQTGQSFGCAAFEISPDFKGTKIEIRAYMKLLDVKDGQAGLMLRIDEKYGKSRFDNMQQRNIHGTSDWKLYSVKLQLPKEATKIYIGAMLTGTGKLWVDDFKVLIDGTEIEKAEPKIISDNQDALSESATGSINKDRPADTLKAEETVVVEKVFIHTDRDSYSPGDDIWFKAYLVEATGLLLANYSKNLHIELISPTSEIVDSRIIKMGNGLGIGDFNLPETIHSGEYQLRAYTNYMRNIGDQLFF